jgi:VWFA-related protein
MRKLLFTFLLIFPALTVSAQQPNASDIFQKVTDVYSGCRSYSDEVLISFKIAGFSSPFVFQQHFRTAYVSPDRFRFEVEQTGRKPWVVWKDGDLVGTSGTTGVSYRPASLNAALSAVALATQGGSRVVPQLLMPRALRTSNLLSVITNPVVTGEEKVDGHAAYRIEGTLWDEPITLWIDNAQYLILKVYRKTSIANRVQEVTFQFKAKLNPDISPDRLKAPQGETQIVTTAVNPASTNPALDSPRLKNFGASLGGTPRNANGAASATGDDDVVRVDTDMVVEPVLVIQPDGKIINGLTKDDFIVKENEQTQQLASLSLGDSKEVPRSIVLIIDYSSSQLPFIRTSIESAKKLVDKLNPKDRMAIVTDDVRLLVDFTTDKQLLKSRLEGLKASALAGNVGASDQFDALMATLTEIFNNADVRPIVIFQTDGDEFDDLRGNAPPTRFWLPARFSFQNVLTAAEKSRVTIYPVISGVRYAAVPEAELVERALNDWLNRQSAGEELLRARKQPLPKERPTNPTKEALMNYATQWRTRQMAMVQLAQLTGAWPEFLETPEQADEIYTRILTDIDRRYIIGYYPTNRARDGKRRKVSVEVRGHPEYLVWGQKSYFAREH